MPKVFGILLVIAGLGYLADGFGGVLIPNYSINISQFTFMGDIATTVRWHGLRPEHRYDGVRRETQQPIPVGGCYSCQVQFPDAGFHWYHPHIREDLA